MNGGCDCCGKQAVLRRRQTTTGLKIWACSACRLAKSVPITVTEAWSSNKGERWVMNRAQRLSIVIALVLIGAALAYSMVAVDDTTPHAVFDTQIYSWETTPGHMGPASTPGWATYYPAGRRYLFISHGLAGIWMGLVLPIVLWAAAIFVALGDSKLVGRR